jgi:hypothetical protein
VTTTATPVVARHATASAAFDAFMRQIRWIGGGGPAVVVEFGAAGRTAR